MNNEIKVLIPEDDPPLEVKQVSDIIRESADHLKLMKRSIEEFKKFNEKAKEFLENSRKAV